MRLLTLKTWFSLGRKMIMNLYLMVELMRLKSKLSSMMMGSYLLVITMNLIQFKACIEDKCLIYLPCWVSLEE